MKIEEIRNLMKSGDVAGAETAAQELLTADPDNVQALMLYGTCRQLQGDEATFRDTYTTVKEHLDAQPDALDAETTAAWKRFEELYAKLGQPELRRRGSAPRKNVMFGCAIVAALIVAALVTGIWYFGKSTVAMFGGETTAAVIYEGHTTSDVIYEGHTTADVDYNQIREAKWTEFRDAKDE